MTSFNDDVAWRDMHVAMWMAREVARSLHVTFTGKDMVITSGRRQPTPGGSSLHPKGQAMDVRSWYFNGPAEIRAFAAELQLRLGPDFDIIVEGPAATNPKYLDRPAHVHIEYDPKGLHKLAE